MLLAWRRWWVRPLTSQLPEEYKLAARPLWWGVSDTTLNPGTLESACQHRASSDSFSYIRSLGQGCLPTVIS